MVIADHQKKSLDFFLKNLRNFRKKSLEKVSEWFRFFSELYRFLGRRNIRFCSRITGVWNFIKNRVLEKIANINAAICTCSRLRNHVSHDMTVALTFMLLTGFFPFFFTFFAPHAYDRLLLWPDLDLFKYGLNAHAVHFLDTKSALGEV